ncbi:MAG: TRAP transporter large permease subunit, partial [Alphaproteobacteria bacterium]|nr:TRAP transporter large permease subunit [Alphaproteobacteria bacterium]
MEFAGLWMLAAVGGGMIATGLPAFVVLIAVAMCFAAAGVAAGALPAGLLTALPFRIIGLLESDLLQALPLYVLMGALLNRLPLADRLFDAVRALLGRRPAAPALTGILIGALLGPMNGSVGAAVATLMQSVLPRLRRAGMGAADSLALVTTASTFGVIVPPSLVLILFGDSMMRAHTEALTATRRMDRIINTADVFHGALLPALLILLATAMAFAWTMRGKPAGEAPPRPDGTTQAVAGATFIFIAGLLALVAAGYLYAVEAAACGGVGLFVYGLVTGTLGRARLDAVLRETMAVTGALFALFVGATSFSLVLRAFGTDRLLAELIASVPGGVAGAVAAVLLMLVLAA